MLKKVFFLLIFCHFFELHAQEMNLLYKNKKIIVSRDTIKVDSVAINGSFFKLLDKNNVIIDTAFYRINFQKSQLIIKESTLVLGDTLIVKYLKFPDFLTREYRVYDKNKVVNNTTLGELYSINPNKNTFKPFDGLTTAGSIVRGISVGNNQNSVVNSALDLQVTGKISDNISLRASIQDSNIPLQSGGYSQKLDEFDQVFVELFSDKWNIRAGDLFLENRKSRFLNFNKKVQGLSSQFSFGTEENKTTVFAAGSVVRGQYAKSTFTGQEGNQGPYKLKGQNGELYVLVISGSERVFVNGILLERGENKDYVIDYNAGEVIFTSLFPITSEMRINIEYQFSDRNYTRFVTYAGGQHERKKWRLGGFVYSENDVKSQPVQQALSEEQAQILVNAGDDIKKMEAPSAVAETFSENKILYRIITLNGGPVYEFSTDATIQLYNVKFLLKGNNLGNYVIKNANAIGKIFEYVAPINGVLQGNYEPVSQLIAPTKIQIATILGGYNPSEKTSIDFELGLSNNDKNLFSSIDDNNNVGIAGNLNVVQRLLSKKTVVDFHSKYQFVRKEFKTIERLFNIEFDRDWNIINQPTGNQSLWISGIKTQFSKDNFLNYQIENLGYSGQFSGTRHLVNAFVKHKNWTFVNNGSYMQSDGEVSKSKFFRNQSQVRFNKNKYWTAAMVRFENNKDRQPGANFYSGLSQRFTEYGLLAGKGDSTKVYVEMGYLKRSNDSVQNGLLQRVNQSNSVYIKSKLIQNDRTNLSAFINYRNLKFTDVNKANEPSLNSRLLYNTRFFDQLILLNTAYENTSGTIAQQEFTYIEVDPGKGTHRWNDYNNNGIQELEEFEISPFIDQGKFIRIFLPNQTFIKTHQNKFSQSLSLNGLQWQNEKGLKKMLSFFNNQTSFLTERKIAKMGADFDFNPFSSSSGKVLGLNANFRNSLFFNRGKQVHSTTYTFIRGNTKSLLSVGSQENTIRSHEINYAHLLKKSWLFSLSGKATATSSISENYASKNFNLSGTKIEPKISYLFSQNANLDIFYDYQKKRNTIGDLEVLNQQKMGISFNFASEKKYVANGDFSYYSNAFTGNEQSPAAFQMLEGLQSGKNLTWRLLLQKKLAEFLDMNINYEGRKSETVKAIHTGNIQLRAFF